MAISEKSELETQSTVRPGDPVAFDPDKEKDLPKGQVLTYDAEDDPYTVGAPPYGWYRLKLFPGSRDPYRRGQRVPGDPDTTWYSVNLECKVQDEKGDFQDYSVFANVSTRVQAGKKMSTMGGLIARSKYKKAIDGKALSEAEMFQIFRKFLAKEPILWGMIDWQGSYKDASGTYQNVFLNYESFPSNGDGGKQNLVLHRPAKGNPVEISARARITEWRAEDSPPSKEERASPKKKTVTLGGGGGGGDDDLDAALAEEAIAKTAAAPAAKEKATAKEKPKAKPAPKGVAADDLDLDEGGTETETDITDDIDADLEAALD